MDRRLAAIIALDVVGYSRLSGEAEEETLERLDSCLDLVKRLAAQHKGRVFGAFGDSVLAEFSSPVEAVRCGIDIQATLREINAPLPKDRRMLVRIGINLGDVLVKDENLYGEGVNIAARMESLALPGGIAVSGDIYRQVYRKIDCEFQDIGERTVKNINEPIHVYNVVYRQRGASAGVNLPDVAPPAAPPLGLRARLKQRLPVLGLLGAAIAGLVLVGLLPLTNKPTTDGEDGERVVAIEPRRGQSIAVLPMQNLGGDQKYDYFSDGLTNDLTTDLAKFKNLFVIASYSSFQFKNKPTHAEDISTALSVRYLLEGSVQRSDDRLRVNAQLIDGSTGKHLWAERYERQIGDLFAIQDDIVQQIVGTLSVKVSELEEKAVMTKQTTNMQAYDLYLKAVAHANEYTKQDNIEADRLFGEALTQDPGFSRALSWRAYVRLTNYQEVWVDDPKAELQLAITMAKKAVDDDPSDYYNQWTYALVSHAAAGAALKAGDTMQARQLTEQGNQAFGKALASNPNDADLLVQHADILVRQQGAEQAIAQIERAKEINPDYPEWYLWSLGAAQFHAKRYGDAVGTLSRIGEPQPRVHLLLAASFARLSEQTADPVEAGEWQRSAESQLATFRQETPDWTLAHESKQVFAVSQDPADQEHWIRALRLAGAK